MDHTVVEYDGRNHNFPSCFPRKRGKKEYLDRCLMSCVLLTAGCILTANSRFEFILNSTSYCIGFTAATEFLSRICDIREEYAHLESRYKNDVIILIKKIFFRINSATIICLFIVAVIQRYLIAPNAILQYIRTSDEEIFAWLLVLAGVKLFSDVIKLDESPVKTAKTIDRINALDYGSGMAINCFYGYLNLVLPGLRERIEDFASRHNVTFASKKMFLLLPLSGKCPQNAADYSPRGILSQSEITEPIELNRGGVLRRNYHNTCYKLETQVNNNKKFLYICCEFASALQTFYEVRQHHHFLTEFYIENAQEIIINFYMTLQKLIEERDFGNYCELIFFRDRDENGRLLYEDRLDIGDLLRRKLDIAG